MVTLGCVQEGESVVNAQKCVCIKYRKVIQMNDKILVCHPYQRDNTVSFCAVKVLEALFWVTCGITLERGIDDFKNYAPLLVWGIFSLWYLFKFFQRHSLRLALESTGIRIMNDKYGEAFFAWKDLPNAYRTHTQKGVPYIVISNSVYTDKELIKLCTKAQPKHQLVYYDNDKITVVFSQLEFRQTRDEVENFISQYSHLR